MVRKFLPNPAEFLEGDYQPNGRYLRKNQES